MHPHAVNHVCVHLSSTGDDRRTSKAQECLCKVL